MAENNQNNNTDMRRQDQTDDTNRRIISDANKSKLANYREDSSQRQGYNNTDQLQSREDSNTRMAQANAESNATQGIAASGALSGAMGQVESKPNLGGGQGKSGGMNDAMSFLCGL